MAVGLCVVAVVAIAVYDLLVGDETLYLPEFAAVSSPSRQESAESVFQLIHHQAPEADDSVGRLIGPGGGGAFFHPAGSPHDPNLLFVSSDMGGFYRSADGGKSWQVLDWRNIEHSRPPVFHPTNPNIVFACPWSGTLLRVSQDAGLTWQPVGTPGANPWNDEDELMTIAFCRSVPNLMFLSGTQRLYRSVDGGRNWTAMAGAPAGLFALFVDPAVAKDRVTVFGASAAGVFRSDNGGVNWIERSNGLPWRELRGFSAGADSKTGKIALHCTIPSRKLVGRFAGGVFRSTDRGDTWRSAMGEGINVALGQHPYGESDIDQYEFLGQPAHLPDTVYVTNAGTGYDPPYHYSVYRTTDGGKTWKDIFFNDPRFPKNNTDVGWLYYDRSRGFGDSALGFGVNPAHDGHLYYTNFGEVFLTTDAGKKWRQAYSKRVSPAKPGKGQPWTSIGLEDTSVWHYVIDPHEPKRRYICYTDIGFARSEDGGASWIQSTEGMPWKNTVYQVAFDPDTAGRIWAACSDQHDIPMWQHLEGPTGPGGVCMSSDFGKTWTVSGRGLPEAPATTIIVDPTSPRTDRVLYVGVYGHGVFKSSDGGKTWRASTDGIIPAQNRQVVSIQRHQNGTLFCSVAGRRPGRGVRDKILGGLFRSTDAGQSWVRITNDAVFRAVDFAVHPTDSKTIYLATMGGFGHESGGLKTTDGGRTWLRLLPQFNQFYGEYLDVFSIVLHPLDPRIVFLFSDTHGMFLSRDAGASWSELGPGRSPPSRACIRMTWDPADAGLVYVATHGVSVWRGLDPSR